MRYLCWLIAVLLVLTAPWPFDAKLPNNIVGFPPWAFYSFCATVVFAVTVFFLLRYAWDTFAGPDTHCDG